ncbi:peptidylprolyl isomerase [Hydrogenophaga sp. PBL-H3]|uniref:peptidylprolyl isomerase n=1 Tax=Hydrogenophaga sp. PBL-H3 TaxID=434010 RepID=UPI00132056F3|nr:peptidylprolyl isomerase [Hydrogenophaga sp. PBL-H3]QHE74805.1 peptidylprolyl isomerase [Hydrogenophaga sp. PBL-H3]QHE79232.1 peptidylprolyl isomerase [Hydrogenophaga sp. PBL-H3]
MSHDLSTSSGCGSSACACKGPEAAATAPAAIACVNGIALHEAGETLDAQTLRERACTELLRQQAVRNGLLPRFTGLNAPDPDEATRRAIEALLEAEVHSPEPGTEECRRHYEAHKPRFVVGQALHVRHILFAVTPGVPVNALAQRAEAALLELSRQGVAADRFAQLAAELSNCPSSAQGGDLGWITPQDCAPELAKALFLQNDAIQAVGLHPRLVHSRFGLHIVEVLAREPGRLPDFTELRAQIGARLALQSQATALRQYMQLLVGQALVEGVELEGADTPLVQ